MSNNGCLPRGYHRMMKAVLLAAAKDYIAVTNRVYCGSSPNTRGKVMKKIHEEARDWFLARDADGSWPFTLRNICDVTGWDIATIRRNVKAREAADFEAGGENEQSI